MYRGKLNNIDWSICSIYRYLRTSPEQYDHLLRLVSPLITKQDTNLREAIPADKRLAVTLQFLASGESKQSLSFAYRIGKSTLSRKLRETCDAIFSALKDPYLKTTFLQR